MDHIRRVGQVPSPSQRIGIANETHQIDRFVLTPHRSLGPKGFLILMALFGGVCFATGLAFLWIRAWPIMGFMGLDILLLYVAFRLNYRAARLSETVEISRDHITLVRALPSGRCEEFSMNAYWANVALTNNADGRPVLAMGSHGKSVRFGAFLSDEEKQELAQALKAALLRHRSGHHAG